MKQSGRIYISVENTDKSHKPKIHQGPTVKTANVYTTPTLLSLRDTLTHVVFTMTLQSDKIKKLRHREFSNLPKDV